jgi:hypothetical protein
MSQLFLVLFNHTFTGFFHHLLTYQAKAAPLCPFTTWVKRLFNTRERLAVINMNQ